MTDAMMGLGLFGGLLGLLVFFFLLILAVLWFFLPFAIFGTKDRLDALVAEAKRTNLELARLTSEMAAASVHSMSRKDEHAHPRDARQVE